MVIKCAHYFPGYHYDPAIDPGGSRQWNEWALVKEAKPFFDGHYQPRVPLWGYNDDSDPAAMEQKLRTAGSYGLDCLAFAFYWYGGKPVCLKPLDRALDLCQYSIRTKPCIMWANHDRYWAYPEDGHITPIKHLVVDYSWRNLEKMVDFLVKQYLSHPRYFRLPDGRSLFILYSPQAIVRQYGAEFLHGFVARLRESARHNGAGLLHVHACEARFIQDLSILLPTFDSCSDYLSLGYSETPLGMEPHTDLPLLRGQQTVDLLESDMLRNIGRVYKRMSEIAPVPYCPVVTVGRDCSPRVRNAVEFPKGHYSTRPILRLFNPAAFSKRSLLARDFLESCETKPPLVFFNAWNEWTEGAYLEPDTTYKYCMLDVLKEVFP